MYKLRVLGDWELGMVGCMFPLLFISLYSGLRWMEKGKGTGGDDNWIGEIERSTLMVTGSWLHRRCWVRRLLLRGRRGKISKRRDRGGVVGRSLEFGGMREMMI